jgi:hypothetical protein
MSSAHHIVGAFLRLRETTQPALSAESRKLLLPPGKDLMYIALVPDIPDNFVPGTAEDAVEGQGQLHYTKVGSQMPAIVGNNSDNSLSDLCRQFPKFGII